MEREREIEYQFQSKFQSLIGFKINWNPKQRRSYFWGNRFQSLIGFKINWNLCFL
ncbi:unknown protein [Microcystis aeruginosa NIES-843]|uniref:Uncharacterized protein n=1 Tax=Microcystis aeruginosa (strain NIES-843 / IAM M-2473) TaxID=449447 RepID=B0JKX6_MICAN|nr:unknown protein [Microcystis aeruginosa NIES-843]